VQTEGHNDKYTTKEEADSLTISLEAIMLSCVNDVKEEINFNHIKRVDIDRMHLTK